MLKILVSPAYELISNTLKVRNMYRKIKNKFWTVYLFISNFDDQINDIKKIYQIKQIHILQTETIKWFQTLFKIRS